MAVPPTTARDRAFPLVGALEAFDAWLRDPTPAHRARLEDALGLIVMSVGARGAWLSVATPELPAFEAGFGTLVGGPPAGADPTEAVAHPMTIDGSATPIGTLWLDAAAPDADLTVRALGLTLDAARARAAVRLAAERLEALDDATRAISGVLDLDLVLQAIVDRVRGLVGAKYAALGIIDSTGAAIQLFITSGISQEMRASIGPPPRGHGLLGLIIRDSRSYRVEDIGAHPDSFGFPPNHPPMRSLLGVPVTVKGHTIGNFYLTDKAGGEPFTEADQRIVENFALHAAIAIENARLHDQVQRLAVVEERDRIAKDLHDGIIQGMYAIALSLEDVPDLMADDPPEAVGRVDRAIDSLNLTIRDLRNFILGLQAELVHGADVAGGLAALAHEFGLNTAIEIDADLDEGELAARSLPVGHRVQLLQIAREALSNAARHARATQASIKLGASNGAVVLTIADNGVGFDVDRARGSGHLGLANIHSRAAAMGGEVSIDSRPGAGTRMIVTLPLAPDASPGGGDRPGHQADEPSARIPSGGDHR